MMRRPVLAALVWLIVLAQCLAPNCAVAQYTVSLPGVPPITLPGPLRVYGGRVYVQIGRNWIPLVNAAGDSMIAPLGLPAGSPATNDNTAETTAVSQTRLSHVANAAALGAWTNYAFPVMRDDVGIIYTDTGSGCPIFGGDGGWQIKPATGHCWQADISKPVSIKLWGAVGDNATDNAPAWQAAVNAIASVGGGTLLIPKAAQCFVLASTITIATNNVAILGPDGGTCVNPTNVTGNGFLLGGSTSALYSYLSIKNIHFVPSALHTNGAMVEVFNVYGFTLENVDCQGVGANGANQCIGMDNNAVFGRVINAQIRGAGQSGIEVGCNGGPLNAGIEINGGNLNYQNRAGIELCNVSGIKIHQINTDFDAHGLWGHPKTNQTIDALEVDATNFWDESAAESVLLDSTGGGTITDTNFYGGVWIASAGYDASAAPNPGYTVSAAPTASCLQLRGTPTSFIDNKFDIHAFNCGGNGVVLLGGANSTDLSGVIAGAGLNCAAANTTCNGLYVDSNISHWSWRGRIGGVTRVSPAGSPSQKYGIQIGAGGGDFITLAGDITGNTTPLLDNSTGNHKNYQGLLPFVPWLAYGTTAAATGGTLTTVYGAMSYSGPGTNVSISGTIGITTNGSGSGSLTLTLPFTPLTNAIFPARNTNTGALLQGQVIAGDNHIYIQTPAGGYPGADNTTIVVSGSYQPSIP